MFYKIQDLLEYKKYCSICDYPLLAILKDRSSGIPNINVKLNKNIFKFRLQYTSASDYLNEICILNVDTNELSILNKDNDLLIIPVVERIFGYACVAVELHCVNNKCKYNYYVCTTFLKPIANKDIIIINPILIDIDCYNISHFWIQNDYLNKITNIFSTSKPQNKPISVPLLEIDPNNKNKIFNRIKTIVNFS